MIVTVTAIALVWFCLAPLMAVVIGRVIAESERPACRTGRNVPPPRRAPLAAELPAPRDGQQQAAAQHT